MSARDDLLRCARDLYVAHGLAGFTLRQVADCAGVSAPAIYRHWESKEDLLLSVCMQGHDLFGRYLARGLKGKNAYDRLILTGEGYLDFALEQRAYYLVMFVAPPEHLGFQQLAKKSDEEARSSFFMLVDRVRECVDEGALAPGDPIELSLSIWAHVHGLVSIYTRAERPTNDDEGAPQLRSEKAFRAFYARSLAAHLRALGPA